MEARPDARAGGREWGGAERSVRGDEGRDAVLVYYVDGTGGLVGGFLPCGFRTLKVL